jgi:hypothetical protein
LRVNYQEPLKIKFNYFLFFLHCYFDALASLLTALPSIRTAKCLHVSDPPESHSPIRGVLYLTFIQCEPIGSWETFHPFSLLVEIERHFTHEFATYVNEINETQDGKWTLTLTKIIRNNNGKNKQVDNFVTNLLQ